MWTLSAGRWMFLLTLALVMIVSLSQVATGCCDKVTTNRYVVKKCWEQKRSANCKLHAYLIETKMKGTRCIDPEAAWIKHQIKNNTIKCPSDVSTT
uniref:CC chemokine n=1 Tax=Paralichthys olivaceus TaxID=8255 RepID=Q8QGV9_PAROL|nr:CC chemokine [Paralichthys olivaceus]